MDNVRVENLFDNIKNVILKYCPFEEDRLYIIDDVRKRKEFNIEISFFNNKTEIRFLLGTNTFKSSVPELIYVFEYINYNEIKKIIDFILNDHQIISNIDTFNNVLELMFSINWNEKAVSGISCGDIKLRFDFHDNIKLRNKYLYLVLNDYLKHLENTPSFINIKNDYLDKIKSSYFNSLNKEELISFISQMNDEELRNMLLGMNNDLFVKYSINNQNDYNNKELILKNSNKI